MGSKQGFTVLVGGVVGAVLAVGFVAFLVDRLVRVFGESLTGTVGELSATMGLAVSGAVESVAAAVRYPNVGPVVQPDHNAAEDLGVTHWQQVPQWDGFGDMVPDPTDWDFPDVGAEHDGVAMISPGADLLAEISRMGNQPGVM